MNSHKIVRQPINAKTKIGISEHHLYNGLYREKESGSDALVQIQLQQSIGGETKETVADFVIDTGSPFTLAPVSTVTEEWRFKVPTLQKVEHIGYTATGGKIYGYKIAVTLTVFRGTDSFATLSLTLIPAFDIKECILGLDFINNFIFIYESSYFSFYNNEASGILL